MTHPNTPGNQATETPPGGDTPVITNDLFPPITLEEDPPGTPSSEEPPAPKPGDPGAAEPTPPPAAGSEESPAEGDQGPFRFKTMEEFDQGYRHIQAHASRVEQENKALRDRIKNRQAEEDEAQERTARAEQFRTYATERRAKLMRDLGTLDPDAENHADELGRLYAEADADIWEFQQNPPALAKPAGGETPPDTGDTPPEKSGREALPPETPTLEDQEAEREAASKTLVSAADAAGIPLDDPTFQGFSKRAPAVDQDGQRIEFKDQVEWAINQTRDTWLKFLADEVKLDPTDPALQHYVSKAPTVDAEGKPLPLADRLRAAIKNTQTYHATQRSQAVQETGAPLSPGARFGVPPGGGPSGPTARTATPAPMTLNQVLEQDREARTL